MKFNNFAALAMLCMAVPAVAASTDSVCGMLIGATGATDAAASAPTSQASQPGFRLRDGEAVDFVSGARTVHGTLLVFGDSSAYRAYWQPEHSAEKYVLANAGSNSVRLVSTPPQGASVKNGEPGTTLAPQQVVSCPAL